MTKIAQFLIGLPFVFAGLLSIGAQGQAPGPSLVPTDGGASAIQHFDPLGKLPSTFTIELRNGQKAELPFTDKRDFDEAKLGFIAEPPYARIMADAGHVAWDMASYGWLLTGKDFESIHPSLQRQAILNMAYGLYEVVPGRIYQVRGCLISLLQIAGISFDGAGRGEALSV
jgi:alkyl sulfatase BDS1-like metallo-beta-lactamase superfamily hydrolase